VRLLEGFEVSLGSRVVGEDGWRLRKAAGVIKLLALAPGHRMHRERAMDLLWPKLDREAAANNLHRTLYAARRVLGSDAVRLREGQILLCPEDPLLVDVETFENTADAARRSRDPAAYRAAVDLYAGDLLPDDLYEGWAQEYREESRGTYLSLLEELAGLYEERGELEPAIESLRKATHVDPTREESHLHLMRLYAGTGRPHRALEQYERLRQALEDLDAEPNTQSSRLREDILAGRVPILRTPSPANPPAAESPGRNNLPVPLTSFVGREREKAEIGRLLDTARLLTLTGTGGCGKSRLALASARELAFPDGTWLVELAALSEAALVPGAVANALGVGEQPGRPPRPS